MPLQIEKIQWESFLTGKNKSDEQLYSFHSLLKVVEQNVAVQGDMHEQNLPAQTGCDHPRCYARIDCIRAGGSTWQYARKQKFRFMALDFEFLKAILKQSNL